MPGPIQDLNAGIDPLSFLKLPVKSTDALLMKAEHNHSCGLPFTATRRTLQDYFITGELGVRPYKKWSYRGWLIFLPLYLFSDTCYCAMFCK
jgi:hypothetical protein